LPSLDLTGIDWVIVGGESGPGHRPLDLGWVRCLRDRCIELGIPFFFKQVGGRTPKAGGRLLDGRTWDQFPAAQVERERTRQALLAQQRDALVGTSSTAPTRDKTRRPTVPEQPQPFPWRCPQRWPAP
jgi:hypothetical protein